MINFRRVETTCLFCVGFEKYFAKNVEIKVYYISENEILDTIKGLGTGAK